METEPIVQTNVKTEPQEKTFTQEEVDSIVTKRLAREMKKMPTEEELTAFRSWKDTQQTEAQKLQALTTERDTAQQNLAAVQAELDQFKREKFLIEKGVPAEDVDYYAFKIAKLVSDSKPFETAAEEFIQQNNPVRTRVDLTGPLGNGTGGAPSVNETMNNLIRNVRK